MCTVKNFVVEFKADEHLSQIFFFNCASKFKCCPFFPCLLGTHTLHTLGLKHTLRHEARVSCAKWRSHTNFGGHEKQVKICQVTANWPAKVLPGSHFCGILRRTRTCRWSADLALFQGLVEVLRVYSSSDQDCSRFFCCCCAKQVHESVRKVQDYSVKKVKSDDQQRWRCTFSWHTAINVAEVCNSLWQLTCSFLACRGLLDVQKTRTKVHFKLKHAKWTWEVISTLAPVRGPQTSRFNILKKKIQQSEFKRSIWTIRNSPQRIWTHHCFWKFADLRRFVCDRTFASWRTQCSQTRPQKWNNVFNPLLLQFVVRTDNLTDGYATRVAARVTVGLGQVRRTGRVHANHGLLRPNFMRLLTP